MGWRRKGKANVAVSRHINRAYAPTQEMSVVTGARSIFNEDGVNDLAGAIVASAAAFNKTVQSKEAVPPPSATRQWQVDAWGYYDLVGELSNAASLFGACMARVDLVPGLANDEGEVDTTFDDEAPTEIKSGVQLVAQAIKDLRAAYGGQTYLNRQAGINLVVAGEFFLYQNDEKDTHPGTWEILSTDELRPVSGGGSYSTDVEWVRYYGPGFNPRRLNKDQGNIIRVWNPHPRYSRHAQSSVRALLEVLEELVLLTREIRGETVSRLFTNGILFIPDEISYPTNEDADQSTDEMDPLTRDIIETCMRAITDKGSAAAAVPIILRAHGESIAQIKFIEFGRADSTSAMLKRQEAIHRFANGFELPVEWVLGHQNTTFDNAFVITEDAFRTYIEPKELVYCDALTTAYLWPYLANAQGVPIVDGEGNPIPLPDDITKWHIHYNASRLVSHPDRSKEAVLAHDRFVISDDALRRAAGGFTEADAPSEQELAKRIRIIQLSNVKETLRAQDMNAAPIQDPYLLLDENQPGYDPENPLGQVEPVDPLQNPNLGKPATAQQPAKPGRPGDQPVPPGEGQEPVVAPAPEPENVISSGYRRVLRSEAEYAAINGLVMRIAGGMEAAVERAVERAQARIRNAANRTPAMAAELQGVPKNQIARTLGEYVVNELIPPNEMFLGEFGPLASSIEKWASAIPGSDARALATRMQNLAEYWASKRLYGSCTLTIENLVKEMGPAYRP